jgi:predicted nucleic acid-binding Zn ribbon protein
MGHASEVRVPMSEMPTSIRCPEVGCRRQAERIFAAPAAIIFRGGGFYATDVTGRIHRKRRPNPGDDLHVEFDTGAARIADAI